MMHKSCLAGLAAAVIAVARLTAAEAGMPSASTLKLERATHTKISLVWDAGSPGTNYTVHRGDTYLGITTETGYTDEDLEPGTSYTYTITPSAGNPMTMTVATMAVPPHDFTAAEIRAVDAQHRLAVNASNASSLPGNIKNNIEQSTSWPIDYTVVDENILKSFLQTEMGAIAGTAALSAGEQTEFRIQLAQIMSGGFNGRPFEQVYVRRVLMALAEKHRQAQKTAGAKALYETALEYSSDDEAACFEILSRLAELKKSTITANSSAAETAAALGDAGIAYLRFIDLFPESDSKLVEAAYRAAAYNYFMEFPKLLTYDAYDAHSYAAASGLLQNALGRFPESNTLQLLNNRLTAWQLDNVQFRPGSTPLPDGTMLRLTNVSASNGKAGVFPKLPYLDERSYPMSGILTVPCYRGHDYALTMVVPVAGGEPLVLELPLLTYQPGQTLTLTPFGGAVLSPSEDGSTAIKLDVDKVDYPYNLSAEKNIDVFTLRWNFVAPDGFAFDHFKVFRGSGPVAQTALPAAANLPLAHADNDYDYTVVAYDGNGNASRSSAVLRVVPGDQTEYADFFSWLKRWFGDVPMLSTDDPDGDGIDNYHEYLAGSDPTRAPGPVLQSGPRGYTTLTMTWDMEPNAENVSYQIRRNASNAAAEPVTVSGGVYTERDLTQNTAYSYSIRMVLTDGTFTDWSSPLVMKTLRDNPFVAGNTLAGKIDAVLPGNVNATAAALVEAIQSQIPDSGNAFSTVSREPLDLLLETELNALANEGRLSADERKSLLAGINAVVSTRWPGNTFEEVYVYGRLVDLAERYWRTYLDDRGRTSARDAAEALYQTALNFLSSDPVAVGNVLNRLADMKLQALTGQSSAAEIMQAVNAQRNLRLDFLSRFGGDYKAEPLLSPYKPALRAYLRYFPKLLRYDSYNQAAYDAAVALAADWTAFRNDKSTQTVTGKIASWELGQLSVEVAFPNGGSGTVELANRSDNLSNPPFLYSTDAAHDVRNFNLTGEPLSAPVYAGHLYDIAVTTPVNGGPNWTRKLSGVRFQSGKTITFSGNQWLSADGPNKLIVSADQPAAPYNLSAEITGDVFNLQWDFVPPNGFILDHFNVYRGEKLLSPASGQYLANIPRGLTADQVYSYSVTAVSADGSETAPSEQFRVLPDFSPEDLAYFEWKQKWFGDAPATASDDSDGDGLTNYQEFLLGTNPTLAPPASLDGLDLQKHSGAPVAWYQGVWNRLPDFKELTPYKQEILNRFMIAPTESYILSSGMLNTVGMVATGYFDVPADGKYKFFLSSDDGSRFSIDGVSRIDHDELNTEREIFTELHLKAGTHSYKIEYFDQYGRAMFRLYWSGPTFERTRFDQSGLWYIDGEESPEMKEYLAGQRDSDGDGLNDYTEIRIGADPNNPDSDSDGIDDATEVNELHTDPLNPDTNGNGVSDYDEIYLQGNDPLLDLSMLTFTPVRTIPGGNYAASTGNWAQQESKAVAKSLCGSLDYQLALTNNGIYRLIFTMDNSSRLPGNSSFDVYIDDILVDSRTVKLDDKPFQLKMFTPYLPAGDHTVRLLWDNYSRDVNIIVESLQIDRLSSLSSLSNSQQDLTDAILQKRNNITKKTASRTSPAFIEGTAQYPQLVTVNGIPAIQLSGNKWYGEFPLTPDAPANAAIIFENGGYDKSLAIEWQTTNIIRENGSNVKIRKGDIMLLSAAPKQPGNAGSCVITCMGQTYTANPKDAPLQVQFNETGTFEISGTYTPPGNGKGKTPESGSITVEVIDYNFTRDDVVCWNGYAREWTIPTPNEIVTLEFDNRLRDASVTPIENEELVRVYIDDNQPRFLIARLGGTGPVLAVQKLSGIDCHANRSTYLEAISEYEDGTQLIETMIVLSKPRSDVTIELDIFVPGILFDTGEISKIITSEDFDEYNSVPVRFLRSPEAESSVCHTLRIYQDGEYVGIRQK